MGNNLRGAEKFKKHADIRWLSLLLQKLAVSAMQALCKCLMYKNVCVFSAILVGGGGHRGLLSISIRIHVSLFFL